MVASRERGISLVSLSLACSLDRSLARSLARTTDGDGGGGGANDGDKAARLLARSSLAHSSFKARGSK